MLNHDAHRLFQQAIEQAPSLRCASSKIAHTSVLDAGVSTPGSLAAGLILARLCLGDQAKVSLVPSDGHLASHQSVFVQTDDPVNACLGAQYAGWPIATDDYFAMGSGPFRMKRGREPVLEHLGLRETTAPVVGILESDKPPSESAIELISEECEVTPADICLAIAPSTSIAGSLQVVARSIETALHKLHELKFDVRSVISATGHAPLPPPAKPGDTVGGIGRTNDAILYGATVTLWVDEDDEAIDAVAAKVPSNTSNDYGQPFAKIFKQYDYDFYKVDPLLFSPAMVTFHSLRSGKTWTAGQLVTSVLRDSFLT
ncbi:MAG: methenyltetrahydromethanopterin cyclohydrolase [Planctomycetota bacterium]